MLLRYSVDEMGYSRTASLSKLEGSVLRYALARSGMLQLADEDKKLVEQSLSRLGDGLGLALDGVIAE